MITIKLKLENRIDITNYCKQYTSVFNFAYNRFQEGLTLTQIGRKVKLTMNNINLMDASLIHSACNKVKQIKDRKNVILGGKKNWRDYNKGLITKEEYLNKKLKAVSVRGEKSHKGNRKFKLDIIKNNQVLFKPKKGIEFKAILPRTKHYSTLCLLQKLCELGESYFNCAINNEYIWITFDETILRKEIYKSIKKRILAIDLNPNFISYVITQNEKVLYKEVIGLKDLNKEKTNKKKHEDFQIVKRIIEKAKHYKVAHIVYEKLNIRSSDKGKGRAFNKACNNDWRRSKFLGNLNKHCNIIGIHTQEVIAQYSSFLGQINNEHEYDSIAAAIELGRRGLLYLRKCFYKENIEIKGKIIGIDKNLSKDLADRWKKKLNLNFDLKTYKPLYEEIKKLKYSYRNLFQHNWFSLRMKSRKSKVLVY